MRGHLLTACALMAALTNHAFAAPGRPPQPLAQAKATVGCAPGANIQVKWQGRWYDAAVKRGPDAQGRCFIGYDGYGANWDEWVTPDRMGTRGATTPVSTQALRPSGTSLPDGRYTCQIWIGSMLSTLGYVDIKGRTYRGPSHTPTGAFKPLAIDATGRMTWSPNFSSLASAGATITGSRVSGTAAKPAFNVDYTTARGYKESIECSRE